MVFTRDFYLCYGFDFYAWKYDVFVGDVRKVQIIQLHLKTSPIFVHFKEFFLVIFLRNTQIEIILVFRGIVRTGTYIYLHLQHLLVEPAVALTEIN
jgi:hypothetical protein